MVTQDQLFTIFSAASSYISQNDLLSLAQTSRTVHDTFAIRHLYRSINVTKDPVFRREMWFLDGGRTYLSGYRAVKKSEDQNDLFLYDRLERLLESPHLKYVKELVIQDCVFSDHKTCDRLLRKLLDKILDIGEIEILDVRNPILFQEYYEKLLKLKKLRRIRIVNVESLAKSRSLSTLDSLEWIQQGHEAPSKHMSFEVKRLLSSQVRKAELIVDDSESSSLPLFSYLQSEGVKCHSLKALKFNHLHGVNSNNKLLQGEDFHHLEDVVNLEKLEKLELGLSCENVGCGCIDEFLMDLAPHLKSLRELGLIEKTSVVKADHKVKEDWDIMINKFIVHIPNVGKNLRTLSIRHETPLNGLSNDSVHGNYFRRRTLYETVLPKLASLEKLIAPTILQSLSAYEVLVCDLLWNGCECDFCQKVLPVFDQYIMNHQYYSKDNGRYMDVIPTVFFAYAGDFLAHSFLGKVEWDIDSLTIAPSSRCWDLHGYEALHHFENYECLFDESTFGPLAVVISHFFDGYMDHLIQILPNLKMTLFSGIYYAVDGETKTYESIHA